MCNNTDWRSNECIKFKYFFFRDFQKYVAISWNIIPIGKLSEPTLVGPGQPSTLFFCSVILPLLFSVTRHPVFSFNIGCIALHIGPESGSVLNNEHA